MRTNQQHLTDEQLLSAADGELLAAGAREAQGHLSECAWCRDRADQLLRTGANFAEAHRQVLDRSLPPVSRARAQLQAQLTDASSRNQIRAWLGVAGFNGAYLCIAILVAALGLRLASTPFGSRDLQPILAASGGPLVPDAKLTPGAVQSLSVGQVCVAGGPRENRPPAPLQRAVFHEYGMDGAAPQGYEVDHLITPALGGSDDIRNLWPESYSSEWNAHVKDELEDYLHDQVCRGKLDLPTAQHEIATNWISAYQKYFHSGRPLRGNSQLMPDRKRNPNS
jgi:anti-sigma factor RsiW